MKHRFSYAERYAIWKAYDGRCFYCEQPVDFQDFAVDHILPESLLGDVEALARIREEYSLEDHVPGFQINDFCNWVPSHPRKCNSRKGNFIYPKRTAILLLVEAAKRQVRAAQEHEQLISSNKGGRVLGQLAVAIEQKHLSVEDVMTVIAELQKPAHDPFVLSFYVRLDDEQFENLPKGMPLQYASQCDWLELDLVRHLRAIMNCRFHYTEPSDRSGDGLGVRIVFLGTDYSGLDQFDIPWWEVLEAGTFSETFGCSYGEAFPYEVEQEYFGRLEADESKFIWGEDG